MTRPQSFERFARSLRHSRVLRHQKSLWNTLRPAYLCLLKIIAPHGIRRTMNGSDDLRLLPSARWVSESYEPDLWHQMIGSLGPGDLFIDVGAYIGLYTVAAAKRVGANGRVIAFEPDRDNFHQLLRHVKLNEVQARVELHNVALSDRPGQLRYHGGQESQSRIVDEGEVGTYTIEARTLDAALGEQRVSIIKIDVEGFELQVLRGARALLSDTARRPRRLFIEMHPTAWTATSVGRQIVEILRESEYALYDLQMKAVHDVTAYGQYIALQVGELSDSDVQGESQISVNSQS